MNHWIKILSVLFFIQLILIFSFYSNDEGIEGGYERTQLLSFSPDAIEAVMIRSENEQITLKKEGLKWMTGLGFLVDMSKIESLLESLSELESGMPAAVSDEAARRFKVSPSAYMRHVTLKDNEGAEYGIYLGTGAGSRRHHARIEDAKNIYGVKLSMYEVSPEASYWQDKSILKLDPLSVESVVIDKLHFYREVGEPQSSDGARVWRVEGQADGERVDVGAFSDAIQALFSLSFIEAVMPEGYKEVLDEAPVLEVKLLMQNGDRVYELYDVKDKDEYLLQLSDQDAVFRVAGYTGKQFVEKLSLGALLSDDKESEESAK